MKFFFLYIHDDNVYNDNGLYGDDNIYQIYYDYYHRVEKKKSFKNLLAPNIYIGSS